MIYEWAIDVQNSSAFPSVASLSYAWSEMQVCADIADGKTCEQLGINASVYVSRTNEELAKVGMLGISVVVAAGDSGAHGRSDINCDSNEMNPAYPASSPYVTAVGGTIIADGISNKPKSPLCATVNGSRTHPCATGGTEVVCNHNIAQLCLRSFYRRWVFQLCKSPCLSR